MWASGPWLLFSILKHLLVKPQHPRPPLLVTQKILTSSFSLPWKKDGPPALPSSLPRRCPTQWWPGSLHRRMSLWPGARPQTKALLEQGLHPQADGTSRLPPLETAAKFISLEWKVSTDQGRFSAQEVKWVRVFTGLSLALGQIADCPRTEKGRKMRCPTSHRLEAGRPADTCALGWEEGARCPKQSQSLSLEQPSHSAWLCPGLGVRWAWV